MLWTAVTAGGIIIFRSSQQTYSPVAPRCRMIVLALLASNVWWSLLVVLVVGIAVIGITYRLFKHGTLRRDVGRDIGIAFLVAAVVSGIYEFNTRSVEEHETVLDTINRAMSAFIPDGVWTEVKEQVLHRKAIRHNVQIEMRIRRSIELSSGATVPMPPGQAALWMRYSYELQALTPSATQLPIQHELDYFMRNEALNLPRFDRVVILGPDAEVPRVYEGATLGAISDDKGLIKLEGSNSITVPPQASEKRVGVITERYEIVNTPGYYYLVMRELTARDESTARPTVTVRITELPDDLEAEMTTFYPAHSFVAADTQRSVWTLDGTLLPGQGLTLTLKPRGNTGGQSGPTSR